MSMPKTEIEMMCEADGNPDLLKEWGAPLVRLGVRNATQFMSQNEGLRVDPATEEGITAMLITLRTVILAYFGSLTQLVDAGGDGQGDTAADAILRAQQRSAMVQLHMLAAKQRPHTVEAQLAAAGLGDVHGRQDAEAKRKRENASRLASQMRDEVLAVYNYNIEAELWADASLYVSLREGFEANELRTFPDLDSGKLGKRGYSAKSTQRLVRRCEPQRPKRHARAPPARGHASTRPRGRADPLRMCLGRCTTRRAATSRPPRTRKWQWTAADWSYCASNERCS